MADQGIGYVDGRLSVTNRRLAIPRIFADSPLLHVEGRGEIVLNDRYDGELHFNFLDSSLDPYLRFFARAPAAFNRFILSGSLDVAGPLKLPHELAVTAVIDDATLTMFDYDLTNDGPVNVAFTDDVFRIGQLKLIGADTNLELPAAPTPAVGCGAFRRRAAQACRFSSLRSRRSRLRDPRR